MTPRSKPKVAVSSCLIGHQVRFDGAHKNNRYLSDVLPNYFDCAPFCPEVGSGLGTPRPTIRLVDGCDGRVEAVTNADRTLKYTRPFAEYAQKILSGLSEVCGSVLKKDSANCRLTRVKIYKGKGLPPVRAGVGIYADVVMNAYPNFQVEEERRLMDARLRKNFLERVFL